jgi:hypothetical protein
MKIALIISSIAIYTLVSCGSQNDVDVSGTPEPQVSTSPALGTEASTTTPALGTEASTTASTASATPAAAVALNPAHGKPGHRCDIAVGAPLDGSSAPAATTSSSSSSSSPLPKAPVNIPLNLKGLTAVGQPGGAGLNPEHGKPGHRCDIAVGAPLNSAATANTAQTIPVPNQPSNPVIQSPAASALNASAPVASATGLNPEHGKPGHRCDIAVGAPLNSKPSAAAAPTAKTATPAVTPVKPGMNPQHGQPGHRCDIAVGAPLNSKPLPAATPAVTTPEPEVKKDSTGGK